MGGSTPAAAHPAPAVRPPSPGRPLRILLAEDHVVNQRLVLALLKGQGHTVVLAGNGREALAALQEASFDLVLMDVQMPVMDGFEATAHIRAKEQAAGRHVPIIALTAHAMKGDRERCLAAGMDGYLAKPIRARELLQAIADAAPREGDAKAKALTGDPAEAVFDEAEALAGVGGNCSLLAELVELFLQDCPRVLAEIGEAVARRDADRLKRAAHGLKGEMSNFSAPSACAAALALESLGRSGNMTGADELYRTLLEAAHRLQAALARLAPKPASS
jgi:CheY-like chemotaxis protein/HPt (histidine-containing phosphotransfer) domain-containing protein